MDEPMEHAPEPWTADPATDYGIKTVIGQMGDDFDLLLPAYVTAGPHCEE